MVLLQARDSITRHFRAVLRRHDLTEQQWRVLRAISTAGQTEVTNIAEASFLHAPSVTRILKELENRNLVSRKVSSQDRRVWIVKLTAKGHRLIDAIAPVARAIYADIRARYGVKEIEQLEAMLIKFAEVLYAAPPFGDQAP